MALFPKAELETYGFGLFVDDREIVAGLERLGRLQHLERSGFWSSLSESNVEQSFVERVFADVFGYATLLGREGESESVEVIAKLYVPLPGSARAFPDFALGFFRADQRETVVTAELKSPNADLDAPQTGNYAGRSPVQQAMLAAQHAHAEWCVVSNTNEVRLYRVPDEARFESISLLDVESPLEFRRAYALFSRRSLLGRSPAEPSPLSRFYAHVAAGESMLVPARADRVRLVQRVRPRLGDSELPFTRLSAALEQALANVPDMNVMSGEFRRPRLEGDQLVQDRATRDEVWQRISMVKSGLLVTSFSLPLDTTTPAGQPVFIAATEISHLLAQMTAFGWKFFEDLTQRPLAFEWSLEDLSNRIRLNDHRQWTRPTSHTTLTCNGAVTRTSFPEVSWNHRDKVARPTVARTLAEVLKELLFPFDGLDDDKRLCRLEPSRSEFEAYLDEVGALKLFP